MLQIVKRMEAMLQCNVLNLMVLASASTKLDLKFLIQD